MTRPLRIGTRGSQLALWQANTVARLLEAQGAATEIVVIRTSGDEPGPDDARADADTNRAEANGADANARSSLQNAEVAAGRSTAPAAAVNVKRLFVKEIEEALLDRRVDLAVHSAKDMPADQPAGLAIAGVLQREDPRDALVLPARVAAPPDLAALRVALGPSPRLGTSSVRRVAQLTAVFPTATFPGIRGNLDTRLRKLDDGQCDALVLAAAGLRRLGCGDRISWPIPFDVCLPSPGQGIVAIETREDAEAVRALVAAIGDAPALAALAAERAVVVALGGGCQMPIGAVAVVDGTRLHARGVVLSADGATAVRAAARGDAADAAGVGRRLADALRAAGAEPLLEESGGAVGR